MNYENSQKKLVCFESYCRKSCLFCIRLQITIIFIMVSIILSSMKIVKKNMILILHVILLQDWVCKPIMVGFDSEFVRHKCI